jgi:ABC-2 type transport system permease protein
MFGRLVRADLKMLVRNRQTLFWAIAFPIIFVTIFGLFDFSDIGEAEVAVFGDPEAAAVLSEAIGRVEALELVADYDTVEEARAALADDEIAFVLVADDPANIELLFNEATADRNTVFIPIVHRVIDELNIVASGVPRAFTLRPRGVSGIEVGYFDFVLPGLVGMAVMTYAIIGLGGTVAQYRAQRILRRIRATPLKPSMFVAALVASHLLLAVIQSSIVLAYGVFVFGGSVRGSLLAIYLFVVLGNLTFLSLGFMVASRVESAEAASGMGNSIAMPMMFFAGVFFPTAGLPWILPTLTRFLPLRPMVDAIRGISISGASVTEHVSELAQLGAWAVVTFLIAARVFRFERA